MENGSGIGSFAGSSSSTYTYDVSSSLNSVVQSAVNSSDKKVILGFMSATEVMNVPNTTLFSLSLKIYYKRAVNFTVKNNCDAGSLKVNNGTVSSGDPVNTYETITNTLEAIEPQSISGTNYIWNDTEGSLNKSNWDRKKGISTINKGATQSISPVAVLDDNGAEFVANMRAVYSVTFQNSGRQITVNGNSYTSSANVQIVDQNSVTFSTESNYSSNGIDYTFNHWTSGGSSYSSPLTVTESGTYTAVYIGKPSNYGKNFAFNGDIGDPINITWTDNQNSNVTEYQIWRRVKHNGILGDATLLATVSRGVQTYTDNEYSFTNGYTNDMLGYDVRAYYEPDGTYSDPQWNIAYGEPFASINENSISMQTKADEVPIAYSITNYPNPFNPTTTINYQLPENSFVTIKVYDMLGKEIATLVDGNRTAGYHNVTFDASRLTSGIYIYTITANNFVQSKKMLLMK